MRSSASGVTVAKSATSGLATSNKSDQTDTIKCDLEVINNSLCVGYTNSESWMRWDSRMSFYSWDTTRSNRKNQERQREREDMDMRDILRYFSFFTQSD